MMVSDFKASKNKSVALAACALALFTTSCGNSSSRSSALKERISTAVKPLIIGMAGFATCQESEEIPGQWGPEGHEMFRRVTAMADYIKAQFGVEASLVASCFTTERRLIVSSSLTQYQPTTPTDEQYLENTHQLMHDYSHIFVVGHSYGGWLTMKLMEGWNGEQNAVKTVYTLDPISKELCFFDNPSECVTAPNDISESSRQHIRDYSGIWVNPWQENTVFLHSSKIEEADMNPKYDLTHWSMLPNEDIWTDIKSRVTL